ncbi:hypothetical protein [Sphingopyxis bauzanensis]|uniref:hypothetical protein n=1 Tax=Sphingopyxis bauzanensis TaxID=651663 RepID=UPI000B4DBB99|nr:hypothetical protein [Sphingopyxis bauzanensis]
MSKFEISDRLTAITAAVQNWHSPTITGGQLFYLMQTVAPQLDFREVVGIRVGPGALTKFAETHLADTVKRIGNQGGDILYHIVGRGEPHRDIELAALWKNFVSPSSPLHLIVEVENQKLTSRATPASNDKGEVEIQKVSSQEHDEIRAKFVESLPAHDAAAMNENLREGASFTEWMAVMKERAPDATRKWGVFRRDHLSALFAERIEALNLDPATRDNLFAQAKAALRAANEKQREAKANAESSLPKNIAQKSGSVGQSSSLHAVRSLAHAAVDVMGYEELRSLRVPLGMIIDSLKA